MPTLNLSNPKDRKTLEELIANDVDAYCRSIYDNEHRNHLGGSQLGKECHRELWYIFRWVKREDFDGRKLRLFNVGHSAEPRFISYLRGIGFEVREFHDPILNYHPESDSYFYSETFEPSSDGLAIDVTDTYHEHIAASRGLKRKQFRISGAKGHYGGSLDGMCKPPARYNIEGDVILLNEFKTNGTGSGYTKVAEQELHKAKPEHWAQCCQYAYQKKIRFGLYMIENKNDSDITFKVVELDWNLGAALERKAEEIIFSKEAPPRISENPAFFNCKHCAFSGICHGSEVPEKNCRSCRNAEPIDNGEWGCHKYDMIIPKDFIKKGCEEWLSI